MVSDIRGTEADWFPPEQAIRGTGIGLTIVRSIVANHHGTMDLRSREGEGTTVVIRLPLQEAACLCREPA